MKTDFKLRQKKFALLLLSLLASLIVCSGLVFIPKPCAADEQKAVVIKNTICVKRWQECKFSLFYIGDYEEICIAEINSPVVPTSTGTLTLYKPERITASYLLSTSVSETVTKEMEINCKISVEEFLTMSGIKTTPSSTADFEAAVKGCPDFVIHVEESSVNKVCGNLIMLSNASKYKLVVYKEVRAKHRSSALSKWGAYKVESAKTCEYCFYDYNSGQNGFFYQKTGAFDIEQYSEITYNIGK